MPLIVSSNLSSYTLAAGEPFVFEVQLLDSSGRGTDITDTAMYLSFYYGGPRALVLDYNGGMAQYQGERFSDATGEFFRFAFDGRFSEGMYSKPGVKVELSRRFQNGRKVIATGALSVLQSASSLPSLTGDGIADTAVRITMKANTVLGGPPSMTQQVIAFNDSATPIPELQPLTLSSASFQRGTAKTVSIVGASDDSTIAGSSLPTGFTVNSGARTVAYDGSGTGAASVTLSLVEALAGATGSPRTSPITATLTAAATTSAMLARLKRANTAALASNPEDQAADATLATITMAATADASLTKIHSGVAGTNPAMPAVARFTGGRYALESNNRAIFPVANAAPSNGSLSALLPATPGYSAWGYEKEFEYTGSRLQFRLSGNVARGWRVRVNGKYVSKSATMNQANSSSNFLTLDFPTAAKKVVVLEGSGSDQIVHIAMAAGDTIAQVASPPEGAISLNTGDSYSEGTGATIPGLFAWVKIAGRRLGETDIRQVAVGSTGYLSNSGGNRKTIRQQVADWPVVNSDINMADVAKVRVAGGYNDYAQANMPTLLQPEVLATLQAIRAMCPNAVVMVYGSHTGARGPDATTIQVENLIKAAFNQWADPNSYFIPIATASPPWITGTGYVGATNGSGTSDTLISADGSHPNDAGHKVISDRSVTAERAIYA